MLRRIDLDPMPGGQHMEGRTLQVRLEVLGHTGIEIRIRRPPDELEGDIQRFHLGKTLGVPRDFFEQFRGHLSEGRSGAGLYAEIFVDDPTEERCVEGLLMVRRCRLELRSLKIEHPGKLLGL